MKKWIISFLFLAASASFAQNGVEKDKVDSFEDSKAGISLKYKPFLWRLFLDKKTIDGNMTKDFAIVKKKSGFNQVRIHVIQLKMNQTYALAMDTYRYAILKERISAKYQSRGLINRPLSSEEIQAFNCEDGRLYSYAYADKFKEVNTISLYFLFKNFKVYIVESYIEKRTAKEDEPVIKEIINSFKLN